MPLEDGARTVPAGRGHDSRIERLPDQLDPNVTPPGGDAPARDAGSAPSKAAVAAADDLSLDAIGEAAELAEYFAHAAAEAAADRNREALRMRLCFASRAVRFALKGYADLATTTDKTP
jgi:hypothetical protein